MVPLARRQEGEQFVTGVSALSYDAGFLPNPVSVVAIALSVVLTTLLRTFLSEVFGFSPESSVHCRGNPLQPRPMAA